MEQPMTYTSRSRIDRFNECNRAGYINYMWAGRGVVPAASSVYFSTGIWTHDGLAKLFWGLSTIQKREEITQAHVDELTDTAVVDAVYGYRESITSFQLEDDGEHKEDPIHFGFVLAEQCALVEAFIRSFAIAVLPGILERYEIIDVEREEASELDSTLTLQGRVDVTLRERETGDLYLISFKTAAQYDKRQKKANAHDIQGLTETYLVEQRIKRENEALLKLQVDLTEADTLFPTMHPQILRAAQKYNEYINRFGQAEKVMGVLMIYLVKGKRYESSSVAGRWEQHSPLIRGYRKVIGAEMEYAHSLFFNNPENKSGKGRLGKGWEPFNAWELEGGIKTWIDMLQMGDIQRDEGDILAAQFIQPAPYFRRQQDIDSQLIQIGGIETRIEQALEIVQEAEMGSDDHRGMLDAVFPQNKRACHYPRDCEFINVCYNDQVFIDPVGSGLFKWREPHHTLEKLQHGKLYGYGLPDMDYTREDKILADEEAELVEEGV